MPQGLEQPIEPQAAVGADQVRIGKSDPRARGRVTRAESRSDSGPQTGFGFCSEKLLLKSLDDQLLVDGEEGQVN